MYTSTEVPSSLLFISYQMQNMIFCTDKKSLVYNEDLYTEKAKISLSYVFNYL